MGGTPSVPLTLLLPITPLPSLHPLPLFQITSSNLKDRYWREMIETKYPSKKAENLDAALARVVDLFSVIFVQVCGGGRGPQEGGGGEGRGCTGGSGQEV